MDSYLEFVLERLSIAGNVTGKAMFGGHGIYLGDLIFGIVADGVLYLKVGESNIKDYIQAGMKPFTYEAKNGKPISMSYWGLPLEILESNEDLPKWVEKAILAARSAKPKKTSSTKSKLAISKKKTIAKKKPNPSKKKPIQTKKKPAAKSVKKKPIAKKKKR